MTGHSLGQSAGISEAESWVTVLVGSVHVTVTQVEDQSASFSRRETLLRNVNLPFVLYAPIQQ